MLIGVVIITLLCITAAFLATTHARATPRNIPPVVELAHPTLLPRIGRKVETLTARSTALTTPATLALPAPTPALETPQATETQPRSEQPPELSIYQTHTGPYAAPVVAGSRIQLPDHDADLPIVFRSAHPDARAIVQAGDIADHVAITNQDGRIKIQGNTTISFGSATD